MRRAIPNELRSIYEELARGGVGAIVTGFTSVSDNAQYIDGAVRISNDALIEDHRRLTDICHAHGCPILVQTALGEYNRLKDGCFERNALTHKDIAAIRELFVSAAIRAKEAGRRQRLRNLPSAGIATRVLSGEGDSVQAGAEMVLRRFIGHGKKILTVVKRQHFAGRSCRCRICIE